MKSPGSSGFSTCTVRNRALQDRFEHVSQEFRLAGEQHLEDEIVRRSEQAHGARAGCSVCRATPEQDWGQVKK